MTETASADPETAQPGTADAPPATDAAPSDTTATPQGAAAADGTDAAGAAQAAEAAKPSEGDDWPAVHAKLMAADILIMATPTWLGQMSSVCLRALERMDALFAETDDSGREFKVVGIGAALGSVNVCARRSVVLERAARERGQL